MFTEDLTAFFDTTHGFAQAATVGGVSGVAVIFDDGNALGQAGLIGMAGSQPSITLPTANVPAEPIGGTIIVNGATYTVGEHQADGNGISRLLLEATA